MMGLGGGLMEGRFGGGGAISGSMDLMHEFTTLSWRCGLRLGGGR